jgi:Yip1 domain
MSLTTRITTLAQLTLMDPRRAARTLLAEDVPLPARTAGLLFVAVVAAVLASIPAGLQPATMDPASAFMLASPFRAAVIQWVFLALSVVLIHNVGRAFGGSGSFPDALLVVVWLQLIMLGFQALQLLAFIAAPPLGGLVGLASVGVFFWLMTCFIAVLHGFAALWAVLAGIVGVMIATGLVIGIVVVSLVGPEVFLTHV